MKKPRRIATMVALITLVSTLTAAPIALGAQCDAAVIGPYGTACGGAEQRPPIVTRVIPPTGKLQLSIRVTVLSSTNRYSGLADLVADLLPNQRKALGIGDVILGGAPGSATTKKKITPKKGQDSEVVVVPGNPTSITVGGFRKSGTTVQILLQASGGGDRRDLGYLVPKGGNLELPTSTVEQGDRATYSLNEWTLKKNGKVDFLKPIASQQRVVIVGTGVASGSTNQLSRA